MTEKFKKLLNDLPNFNFFYEDNKSIKILKWFIFFISYHPNKSKKLINIYKNINNLDLDILIQFENIIDDKIYFDNLTLDFLLNFHNKIIKNKIDLNTSYIVLLDTFIIIEKLYIPTILKKKIIFIYLRDFYNEKIKINKLDNIHETLKLVKYINKFLS